MKRSITLATCLATCLTVSAQTYELTAPRTWQPIHSEHLQMGGCSPTGGTIAVNNFYLTRDGKPVIPVMGEFHYCRYPAEQWEQEILKIKAGGVNVIPSYIFWSLHEPQEGKFCWEGNLDLRRFVELCQKHGMDVIVRIGPFGHGEIRNGGLPDWLFAKHLDVRSNDPQYLAYTRRLYQEIARQLEGLYYKDGGPIIACQIENEHQHSAAPWAIHYGPEERLDMTSASYDKGITKLGVSVQESRISQAERGTLHMATLLQLAQEAGIRTPVYTTTGWGNAAVIPGKAIPVTAGYTYPTWVREQQRSAFCLMKNLWEKPDYSPVRYASLDYPSASAEMGVGIQMVYDKRPICTAEAAEALMLRCLAGGSNLIGYYMYHGGTTPRMHDGKGDFFSDQPMGLPKMSYDFQAPLGEMGLEAPSYRPLRVIHHFLADFQERLAPMQPVMPDNVRTLTPDNRDDLRYAARMTPQGEGFLFLVNTQDHDLERHDMTGLKIKLNLPGETLLFGGEKGFTLPKNTSAVYPFHFDLEGIHLLWATAQPLMKMDDRGTPHYFFTVHDGVVPQFAFAQGKTREVVPGRNSTFTLKGPKGKVKVTVLPYADALNAVKVAGKLLITPATVVANGHRVKLLSLDNPRFEYTVYPSKEGWKSQTVEVEAVSIPLKVDKSVPGRMEVTWKGDARDAAQVNEYFLSVPYTGSVAMAFLNNEMVLDHFWQGKPWRIALNRFADQMTQGKPMGFYFRPLRPGEKFIPDIPAERVPDLSQGPVLQIADPQILPEYTTTLTVE